MNILAFNFGPKATWNGVPPDLWEPVLQTSCHVWLVSGFLDYD